MARGLKGDGAVRRHADFRMPLVKVCGLTSIEDVRGVLRFGVEAVGLVEYPPSPRALSPASAARIATSLPEGILKVAVMVDRTPGYARTWIEEVGANAIQLCGTEDPGDWKGFAVPILRRVAVEIGAKAEIARWTDVAQGFVLDHPASHGGTGTEVDPVLAFDLTRRAPCLLAGGLDADNVERLVRAVRPAGVDASSRLESLPGRKDQALVQAFVRAAKSALDGVSA